MVEFLMPSLGADMEAGTLIEWRKKAGDPVHRGDIIAEVDTQKGLIEIEVFDEGIVGELLIKEGTKVPVGTVMAIINQEGSAVVKHETVSEPVPLQPTEEKKIEEIPEVPPESRKIKASPLAKRIAAENDIDLSRIIGSGEGGAISKEDVERAIALKAEEGEITETPSEKVSAAKINTQVDAIRSAVAAAMSKSNREIPHYFLEKKIDMGNALTWLKETNAKRQVRDRLLPAALLIKATAKSLIDVPELNAVWDNRLQLKKEINIGFVVSLRGGGIMVPAIHQADVKTISEIMVALNDIIMRTRALKLRSSDLSDTTITITNLGEGGADTVYGIIYPPQVAIVGFGAISEQPFSERGIVGSRPVLHATLSGDHRATDGLTGSRFLTILNKQLQNPETL